MKEDRKTLRDSSIAGIGDWSLGRRSSYVIFWAGEIINQTFTTKVGPPGERVQRLTAAEHHDEGPRAMEKQWRNWGQHAIVPVDRRLYQLVCTP
ncbi:hypothetical protein E4U17_001790 [Claviceps sp. LM77 group G4]|nr:hypothetical protein E4U17_001790 [Claviceps sp. LM77 group G4]KAG6071416.1 hypothetical protein E4U33_003724 [Claviceps sp. LM78 group G4]KAG6080902.1 hypothetical protein E4U16_008060 [Claviceps sp. LM84 group G4]